MSRYKVAHHPAVLSCIGLGSCIGIVLYDAVKKMGGLAHVMLPRRKDGRNQSNPGRFADSAIEYMLDEMERQGSARRNIHAKIFGGANMFPGIATGLLLSIGEKNIAATREELNRRKIKIVAEDLGGHFGRTIVFDTEDGLVRVRNVRGEENVY